jgi:predicted N-acetyltransferase YhbS
MRLELLSAHRHLITKIASLLHEEWGCLLPWASLSNIEDRFVALTDTKADTFTLVALSTENEFLGTASVKLHELEDHPDKKHWLGEVFIPRPLRGQGIGSSLIRECLHRSADLGVNVLFLYTPDQQALYERFGWREIETTTVNAENVSIMACNTMHNPSFKRDA